MGIALSAIDAFWLPGWFAQGILLLVTILVALLVVILLYVIYRVLARSGVELSVTISEHPGELTGEYLEKVEKSLAERGIRARVEEGRIRIMLVGFYVEARGVSTPVNSVVYKVGAEALGIVLAIILLILFPPGWLLLALILVMLYTRYSELRKIVELAVSEGKGQAQG
ncbi:MAG: hypothetical protein F7C07_04400 [Desulfurococcales archaeon]|nr:hypothetical protein [Desulfurococcales archaeon]